MKILFISAIFPYPLVSGGHIRIYHLLKRLGKEHEITLFAHIRTKDEEQNIGELAKYCHEVRTFTRGRVWQTRYMLRAATSNLSLLQASYDNWSLTWEISQKLAQGCDVVHCEPFYVAHVIPKTKVPVVIAEHNLEYEVYRDYAAKHRYAPGFSQLMRWDIKKMQRNEEEFWQKAKRVVCVSREDQQVISQKAHRGDIAVVPNGVDPQFFTFRLPQVDPRKPRFLFVGNYSWFPNREALDGLLHNLWPLIRAKWPGAVLTLAGPHLPAATHEAAIRAGVEVLGWVKDIRPVYAGGTMLLAPMDIGGGTKFKVLEAMASGLPVVTSPQGAAGLEVKDGVHLLLAATPKEFLAQAEKIVKQKDLRDNLATAARQLVEQRYSWDVLARELSAVWKSCL